MKELEQSLKRYFGFSNFRPLQREIVSDLVSGHDLLAILPTGGGKSLCYQLPALLRPGLTVVISPLIALMKDQVDSLQEMDIRATFLNSSLNSEESKQRWKDLFAGKYKLLYLAPERLMTPGMIEALRSWNLSLIAVDEAHCISDWGHDFRPEYRALAAFRENFPDVPVAAFTATATERVQRDILSLLQLKSPKRYLASFNRHNLSYRVVPRISGLKQIIEVIHEHPEESGIIYCLTRSRTEELAEALQARGVSALAYHAGLNASERSLRQDRFIKDEVSIMVATVAFGMGVDKPDVRFVIHQDLPKNIESYYQETGRAGRDGLPSECILLYNAGDAAKIRHFIDQMSDAGEQAIARKHLTSLISYCESPNCRRLELLRYFGETYLDAQGRPTSECGSCDNCLTPRERIDGTQETKMLLSCVLRIRKASGFAVGLQHVLDVLLGSENEKVKRFGHHTLSTYGIGKDRARAEWIQIARELIQRGLLSQNAERFQVLELTPEGYDFLRSDMSFEIARPLQSTKLSKEKRKAQQRATGGVELDESLFSRLKDWRRSLASSRGIPAYVICHDSTLQAIAQDKPKNKTALATIPGMGEKKIAQYGDALLELISNEN